MRLSADALAALKRRDPVALRQVTDAYAARLYRATRRLGVPPTDADDLVQEVFTTFLASLDRFEGRSEVYTWLYGILVRQTKAYWRRFAREAAEDPIDDAWESRFDRAGNWVRPPIDPYRALESRRASDALRVCMDGLPPKQRAALLLRRVERRTAGDTAELLGLSVTHIGVLVHRARQRIRACLETHGWSTA